MRSSPTSEKPLREIAWLFLKLGATAFGGPAAHIAMMEDEVVRRRRWLTHEEFLDLLGATNLIPGPNSTEMAIHIGHRRGGWAGLLIAGVCFIVPAMLIVLGIAWAYQRFGKLPEASSILYGVKPVIIAVVIQALWGLGRKAVKTPLLAVMGILALVLCALGVDELLVLFVAGIATGLCRLPAKRTARSGLVVVAALWPRKADSAVLATSAGMAGYTAAIPFSPSALFLFFLKVGSVLFGSGYVLLAFLRSELVERWGWLSDAQLMDAIAVGQVTPGPVFTTATFIGYVLGGPGTALLATLGIFLPAFVFVALSGPLVPRLRRSALAGAVLDGVNVASLALMVVVTWQLARGAMVDVWTWGLAALAAFLLLRWKVNSAWLVLGGACAGWLLTMVR